MTQKKKDTGTPNKGRNESGVGGQYDPNHGKGSIEDTKPGNSSINNPPKETKDETEKAKKENQDEQAH
jgi:hypothetical protein